MGFASTYLAETAQIARDIDAEGIESLAIALRELRDAGGRLFIIGAGGGAGHASHAVNDFRKICDIESYSPSDNVSELTARINDQGWDVAYSEWILGSRVRPEDAILIFSVGGGSKAEGISVSIVNAIDTAQAAGAKVFGIVGRHEGYTAETADVCIVVPCPNPERLTPHAESFQAVVWHLLVSHPLLAVRSGTWEAISRRPSS